MTSYFSLLRTEGFLGLGLFSLKLATSWQTGTSRSPQVGPPVSTHSSVPRGPGWRGTVSALRSQQLHRSVSCQVLTGKTEGPLSIQNRGDTTQGICRKTSKPIKGPSNNPELNDNGVMTTRWLQGLREEIELPAPEAGVTRGNGSHERARATSEACCWGRGQ